MAVIPYATKVLSHSPVAYWDLGEASGTLNDQGSANADLTVTGSPTYQRPSLLKDASGYAMRFNTGSASVASGITTTDGQTLSFMMEINAFPSGTMYPVTLGTASSGNANIRIGLYVSGALRQFRLNIGYTGGITQAEFGSLVVDRKYHVVITSDPLTNTVKGYIDGYLVYESTVSNILSLSNQGLALASGSSVDYEISQIEVTSGALTADEVRDLFLSSRAIDEDETDFYVAPDGDYFGDGSELDPIDIQTAGRFGGFGPGSQILLTEGTYQPTSTITWNYQGTALNPIIIKHKEGDLAVIDGVNCSGSLMTVPTTAEDVYIVQQTYAKPGGGIAGIRVTNSSTRRIAVVNGSDPENATMNSGTLTNDGFVSSNTNYVFTGSEGLTFNLYNSGVLQFTSTVETVNGIRDITLADSYGGTQALGGSWTARIERSVGGRDNGGGITIFGSNCKIKNVIADNTGDAVAIWEQAVDSEWYGGIVWNPGWAATDRGHGQPFYSQNNDTTQSSYRKIRNVILSRGFAQNGKLYGASGYADAIEFDRWVSFNGCEPQRVFYHDILPEKIATGTVSASSTSMSYTNSTGTLAANDYIRIKGAGRNGQDFFTRIVSVGGGTATLRHAVHTSVTSAVVTVATTALIAGGDASGGILIGSGAFDKPSKDVVVTNGRSWQPLDGQNGGGVGLGYAAEFNQNLTFTDCYLVGQPGWGTAKWLTINAQRNTAIAAFSQSGYSGTKISVTTKSGDVPGTDSESYLIDHNDYHFIDYPTSSGLTLSFFVSGVLNRFGDLNGLPFADADTTNDPNSWQELGYDANGAVSTSRPTTNVVFVDPQDGDIGQLGRANIAIYNWELLSEVEVDLSTSGLVDGQHFEIRDAEDFLNTVLVSGVYDENDPAVMVPTTGFEVDQPIGWTENGLSDIPSTKPEFIAGVLLPFAIGENPTIGTSPFRLGSNNFYVNGVPFKI